MNPIGMTKYLPLGSVVLLTGGRKRVMVFGRHLCDTASGRWWDYVACPFPEGSMGDEYTYLFNHDQVERVFFVGLQDSEEMAYQDALSQSDAKLARPGDSCGEADA